MVCVYCSSATRVSNSRHNKRANVIWRRRECLKCGSVVTTYESLDLRESIRFSTPDGRLDAFNRNKLFISLYESCKHRPTAITDAEALTATIVQQAIETSESGVIQRNSLAAIAAKTLERFDKSAATIYRAYHPAH